MLVLSEVWIGEINTLFNAKNMSVVIDRIFAGNGSQ